jgi:hypothetical protein
VTATAIVTPTEKETTTATDTAIDTATAIGAAAVTVTLTVGYCCSNIDSNTHNSFSLGGTTPFKIHLFFIRPSKGYQGKNNQ